MSEHQDALNARASEKRYLIERRQFLAWGSVAVVGLAARGLSASTVATSASASTLPTVLSLGFVDGLTNDEGDTIAYGEPRVVSTRSLMVGDPRFLRRGARVNVLGMWRQADHRNEALAVSIVAYFPTSPSLGGGDLPVYTWSQLHKNVNRPATGSFPIPIDQAGMRLQIEARAPQAATSTVIESVKRRIAGSQAQASPAMAREVLAAKSDVLSLSIGGAPNTDKLKAGTYIVALQPPGSAPVDWSSVRFNRAGFKLADGPVWMQGLLGSSSATFDYILFNVAFVA